MKFYRAYISNLYRIESTRESACLLGIAGGRVKYEPEAKWLYSLRVFLLFVKLEIMWTTGDK